jgi:hypothetical protein
MRVHAVASARLFVLLGALLIVWPAPVLAAPIQFATTLTSTSTVGSVPIGEPITLRWTFDSDAAAVDAPDGTQYVGSFLSLTYGDEVILRDATAGIGIGAIEINIFNDVTSIRDARGCTADGIFDCYQIVFGTFPLVGLFGDQQVGIWDLSWFGPSSILSSEDLITDATVFAQFTSRSGTLMTGPPGGGFGRPTRSRWGTWPRPCPRHQPPS